MLLWVMQWISPSPGVSGFLFSLFLSVAWVRRSLAKISGYWRFDWTLGGQELVFVKCVSLPKFRFFILYYYK